MTTTPLTPEQLADLRAKAMRYLTTGSWVDDGKFIEATTAEVVIALLDEREALVRAVASVDEIEAEANDRGRAQRESLCASGAMPCAHSEALVQERDVNDRDAAIEIRDMRKRLADGANRIAALEADLATATDGLRYGERVCAELVKRAEADLAAAKARADYCAATLTPVRDRADELETKLRTTSRDLCMSRAAGICIWCERAYEIAPPEWQCECGGLVANPKRAFELLKDTRADLATRTADLAERTRERDAARKVAAFATMHRFDCASMQMPKSSTGAPVSFVFVAGVQYPPAPACTCGLDAARKEAGL